jgi:hypothetical protein
MPHIVHRWEPDPDVAPLVRQAFEMRAAGYSYNSIARVTHLYTSKGGWGHFFANPLYKGEMIYGGTVIAEYCEPIVDAEIWNAVQIVNSKTLEAGMSPVSHPRAKSSDYILTGLLKCARCGSPLIGWSINARSRGYLNKYYACTSSRKPKDLRSATPRSSRKTCSR